MSLDSRGCAVSDFWPKLVDLADLVDSRSAR